MGTDLDGYPIVNMGTDFKACTRIAACVLVLLAGRAGAQEGASDLARFGLGVGYSATNFDEWGAADPSGHAIDLRLEYRINRWLGVEASRFDASRVSGPVFDAPFTILPDERTVEARAVTIGPTVRYELDLGLSVQAIVGYARTDHFYRRVGGTFLIPDFTPGETRHDDELFYGASVAYSVTDAVSIQADYRRLEFSDLPLHSAGLVVFYRFGRE